MAVGDPAQRAPTMIASYITGSPMQNSSIDAAVQGDMGGRGSASTLA